jgi:hypothetical protein
MSASAAVAHADAHTGADREFSAAPDCNALKLTVPQQDDVLLSTYGFTRTAILRNGDLFLLPESLRLTVVAPPPEGLSIFPVNRATFGGNAEDLGGFPGTKGLAFSGTSGSGARSFLLRQGDQLRDRGPGQHAQSYGAPLRAKAGRVRRSGARAVHPG